MPAAGVPAPPDTDLITQMFSRSVTNEWDVVFNMGLSEINNALKDQYEALNIDKKFRNTISVNTSQKYPGHVTGTTKFVINYGYPKMTFSINSGNTVQLDMQILDGTMQICSKVGENPETCDPAESIKGETLTAFVDLAKVSGEISENGEQHSVLEGTTGHGAGRVFDEQHATR